MMDEEYLSSLSVEEIDKLYYSSTDDEKRKIIFYCSDDLKLKEAGIFSLINSDTPRFIMSFKDADKRKACFYQCFGNGEKFVLWLALFLDYCDSNDRVYFINLFFDYIEEKSFYNFSCFEVSKMFEFLNDKDKELLLDRFVSVLEKKEDNVDVVVVGLEGLINLFPLDKRVSVFEKFLNLKMLNKSVAMGSIVPDILKELDNENRFKFITWLLDNDLLSNSKVFSEVFECFLDEEKDGVLRFIQDYEVNNNKKVLDFQKMAFCLEKYNSDIRLEKFKTLVMIGDNLYESYVLNVANCLEDVKFKFEAINLYVEKLLYDDSEEIKEFFLNNKEWLFNCLSIVFNNQFEWYGDKFPDKNIIYDALIDFYVDFLKIDKDNLIKFINRFGYVSLRYLESNNIKAVINLDSNKFDLFINLFREDNLKLDNDTYNTVINAILQREFMVQCSDDYNIFSRLEGLINISSIVELEKEILDMSGVINIKTVLLKYNLDINSFLERLVNGDKGILDILHEITNQYIMKKREIYVKERMKTVNDELDLDKKYEKNFIKKKWVATNSIEYIIDLITSTFDNDLNEEQLFLIKNIDILEEIIKFRKGAKESPLDEQYRKYLKVFDSLLDILYEDDELGAPTNDPNAKFVYSAKNIDLYTFIDFISELDISKIDKFLLSDESLVSSLDDILSKYKLLGWGKTFSELKDSADFDFYNNTLVGLFNYFYRINDELMNTGNKKFSLTKMISLANCYSSTSSKYCLLFGEDIFKLLVANEGKNKASMIRYRRLELAVEHLKGMYNREVVPVPHMNFDYELYNGKKINVVVGNITDMNNLVLGEMTNSCMRIGGAFYDFYKECLGGTVGFHIVFSEPETNKFISRVSGIRNGNTVFFNELRFSEHEGYNDKDLQDLIYKVSGMLISASKSSEYPIDNVVITADNVMKEYEDKLIDLHLKDRNEALYGLNHNLDASGKAILLASSRNDGKLVDIVLGEDKIGFYRPQRDNIEYYEGEEASKRVAQLEMINYLLNGVSLEDIDIDLNKDIKGCISGGDWYISLDRERNLKGFILDNCKDKDRAKEEMDSYMDMVKNKVEEKKGGVSKK